LFTQEEKKEEVVPEITFEEEKKQERVLTIKEARRTKR
jgi:hypothetical protein